MSRTVREEHVQSWAGMSSECGSGPWGEGAPGEGGDGLKAEYWRQAENSLLVGVQGAGAR